MSIDVNPVDVAVEMIRAALPGFATRVDPAIDAVVIHGALPIASQVSAQAVFYPIMRPDRLVSPSIAAAIELRATEDEIAIMRVAQRDALRRELGPTVDHIVDRIRGYGMDALGLKAVIEERERKARIDGRRLGYSEGERAGRAAGLEEGRAAGIRDLMRLLMQGTAEVGEAVDEIRAAWGIDLDD